MKCGSCKAVGHNYRSCLKRPGRTDRIDVPANVAAIALGRVEPFISASRWSENFMNTVMLSCYLQGLMDGQTIEVRQAVKRLQAQADREA